MRLPNRLGLSSPGFAVSATEVAIGRVAGADMNITRTCNSADVKEYIQASRIGPLAWRQ